uniref:Uncharacterized protein n=1 Tax=Cajanus cajan TaxID=3821 RepID=A0A151R788_CAJCA|nr:hypothetical protein KK1_040529 [Cajanus cajan]
MCIRVLCRKCGKYSWAGCGSHLNIVYKSIQEGNHCMCRSWPGVIIPSPTQQPAQSSTITTPPQGKLKQYFLCLCKLRNCKKGC